MDVIPLIPPADASLTSEHVQRLLDLNAQRFPGWSGFGDPRFLADEVTYKRHTVAKVGELLDQEELERLLDEQAYDDILSRLETLGRDTNLLWQSVPMSGDLGILYQEELDKPSFCRAFYDLLYGPGPSEDRLSRFAELVVERGLPNKWTFPTYFLFLRFPESEMFVKPYAARWFLQLAGMADVWDWKPNPHTYAVLKALVADLREALSDYGPHDNLDIQGLLWATYWGDQQNAKLPRPPEEPEPLAKPFTSIFRDRDEATWALGILRQALDHVGIADPNDQRIAVTTPAGARALRLIVGDRVAVGFRRRTTGTEAELILLSSEGKQYAGLGRESPFVPWDELPAMSLFKFPIELVREQNPGILELHKRTLGVLRGYLNHWRSSRARAVHQAEIADALFTEGGINDLLAKGVSPRVGPESYLTEETFALLEALSANPTREYYLSHKDAFVSHVEEPVKEFLAGVASRLRPQVLELMETEKGVTSRILKNDYGRGGAWPHYWGAFYPKGGRRTEDAQLYVFLNKDGMRYGFYIGDYGEEPRERLQRNILSSREQLGSILAPVLGDVPDLSFGPEEGPQGSLAEWLRTSRPFPGIGAELSADEVVLLSREELTDRVVHAFAALFPFVLLATSDQPLPAVREYLDDEGSEAVLQPDHPLERVADQSGVSAPTLVRWITAIERKKQAIMYGPPGTGKTFMAKQLARHMVGGGDGFADVVQFHPAYAYEDFLQGIRPQRSDSGGLEYPVVPGRFVRFCDRAAGCRGTCVLVIDEINRANLARVFGELMYLLEYRDEAVQLAVDGRSFRIPTNVRILGTMNTADRSIALVDHALRRRFAFIAVAPNYDALTAWHQREGTGFDASGLIGVLKRLNRKIDDANYEVGVSFFMVPDTSAQLQSIWEMEIEPYLEEFFFDDPEAVAEFRWDVIAGEVLPG